LKEQKIKDNPKKQAEIKLQKHVVKIKIALQNNSGGNFIVPVIANKKKYLALQYSFCICL